MLHDVFEKIYCTEEIPEDWKNGCLITFPKKGNLKECNI